ncbi:hypothetical protein [Agrococcus jejuensis]|uniref:Uncharacterized protein n=1 Tax=Agrococcus jejuensis TaxID=399736 RepID=A0A1G8BU46_9MICO|nr:hypothetical protein [Agrococcus jejuensis]SDH36220.1 hypothetical protein SAMN04489720_1043 [Agrococcus jejuensis]
MSALPYTVGEHKPEVIEGRGYSIQSRGRTMGELGEAMQTAATLLKQYEDGATGEKGLSITAIKDSVKGSHEDLDTAGERYSTSGALIEAYGLAVIEARSEMTPVVADLEELWAACLTANDAVATADDAHSSAPDDDPEAPAPPGQGKGDLLAALGAAQTAASEAREAYDQRSKAFDEAYDTWWTAYKAARDGLEDAIDDDLEDGWRDKLADIVEVLVTVLTYVGIALAIAALVLAGPVLGAIAAVVAVLALVGTLYLKTQGRADWGDVAWAAVGVVPFGKIGKVIDAKSLKAAIDPDTISAFKQGFKNGILNGTGKAGSPIELLTGSIKGVAEVAKRTRPFSPTNLLGFGPNAGVAEMLLGHTGDVLVRNVVVPSYSAAGLMGD